MAINFISKVNAEMGLANQIKKILEKTQQSC